jgi:V/A-type H+-transporting ATPase subunit K|tara:strand:+ start:517 stop:846 length:330 start_codon:yes stop_codon:yes gene_type:complete
MEKMEEINMKINMVRGMRLMLVLMSISLIAGVVSGQTADEIAEKDTMAKLGAGIALAGCGIGTGLGQGQIGAAAVGMIAEDSSKFGTGLLFTVLPETVVLFGFLAMFLL